MFMCFVKACMLVHILKACYSVYFVIESVYDNVP